MSIAALIEQYVEGPGQLRTAIAGMTAEQFDSAPIPGKWSTRQVVCHIADFEPVYADRMKRVIAEEKPTIFGGDPDVFAARLAYDRRDVVDELNMIEAIRKHVAAILRSLPNEAYQREATHSVDGPLSLEDLLKRITNHIPHHLRFVEEKRAAM